MTFEQVLLRTVGNATLVLILAGIAARARFRECVSFAVYILAVLVPQALETIWPERFYTRDLWLTKEALHQIIKLAVALELTARTVAAFPSARRSAQLVLVTLLWTVLLVLAATFTTPEWCAIVTDLLPTVLGGTVWIFAGLTFVILWYRLPVTDFAKAILLGFVGYLVIYGVALGLIGTLGWKTRPSVNLFSGVVYLLVTVYWCHAAWRNNIRARSASSGA